MKTVSVVEGWTSIRKLLVRNDGLEHENFQCIEQGNY